MRIYRDDVHNVGLPTNIFSAWGIGLPPSCLPVSVYLNEFSLQICKS